MSGGVCVCMSSTLLYCILHHPTLNLLRFLLIFHTLFLHVIFLSPFQLFFTLHFHLFFSLHFHSFFRLSAYAAKGYFFQVKKFNTIYYVYVVIPKNTSYNLLLMQFFNFIFIIHRKPIFFLMFILPPSLSLLLSVLYVSLGNGRWCGNKKQTGRIQKR
jgi:hypothetical protein